GARRHSSRHRRRWPGFPRRAVRLARPGARARRVTASAVPSLAQWPECPRASRRRTRPALFADSRYGPLRMDSLTILVAWRWTAVHTSPVMLKRWFHRVVLSRRWLTFLVMGLAFFVFGAGTYNLVMLLQANAALISDYG